MTNPDPMVLIARQQDMIDQLCDAVELMQNQVEVLRRRVQALEGPPLPATEPPGS